MAQGPILTDWTAEAAGRFGGEILRLEHSLDRNPLFAMDALAELIESYPREHYSLVETGRAGGPRVWHEGEFGGLSGRKVIEAIAEGRMWLNLRNLSAVDGRYRELLDRVFEELAAQMPGFAPPRRNCGLLISSPEAEVYYHADLPGQALLQLAGRKRVWIYPATPPFVSAEDLEDIALFDLEVGLPYDPAHDAQAQIFDLEPGAMLHWPLNAPHRVQNLGCLNVSMTISYQDEAIRRAGIVHLANAILRHRFGHAPRSRALAGPGFWAKALLQKAMRKSAWMARQRKPRQAIAFRLDRSQPGRTIPLREAA